MGIKVSIAIMNDEQITNRVDRLEEIMAQLSQDVSQLSKDVSQVSQDVQVVSEASLRLTHTFEQFLDRYDEDRANVQARLDKQDERLTKAEEVNQDIKAILQMLTARLFGEA